MPIVLSPLESTRIALTDREVAAAFGMSLGWVRKDRLTKRILPFYRIGDCIRYDLQTVRKALMQSMEGGTK
jgi:hypothetical protein